MYNVITFMSGDFREALNDITNYEKFFIIKSFRGLETISK